MLGVLDLGMSANIFAPTSREDRRCDMGFREQTSAFFDELTNIVNQQMKDKAGGMMHPRVETV